MKNLSIYKRGFQFLSLLVVTLFFSAFSTLQAQSCTTPPNILENGDFDLPTTAINVSNPNVYDNNTTINNVMPGWRVSHGHPSTQTLPNRNMWMWSYDGGGEGIYNCYNFEQGVSYRICFDLKTNSDNNGGNVFVEATTGLNYNASTTPAVPSTSQQIWSDLVSNYNGTYTNISVTYTPNANYDQFWVYPFRSAPSSGAGDQSEMTIDNIHIERLDGVQYTATADDDTVCIGGSSQLLATGGTSYSWSPAAGLSCTNCADPIATPSATTTYTVTITNSAPCAIAPVTRTVTVYYDTTCVCPCQMNADFSYSSNNPSVPCDITFQDNSSTNSCTNILAWSWDFGDGNTSNQQNPQHLFAANGTYTVCLTTVGLNSNGDCCTDKQCYNVTVDCDPCVCDVTADFSFDVNQCRVDFNDQSSGNSCTNITGWSWDFDDGNTSTQQNPTHVYSANGTYNVCLTVYGTDGTNNCEETICYPVLIDECGEGCECFIDISHTYNAQGCDVAFYAEADSDCEVVSYFWDFGDGNTSNQQNPNHSYSSDGNYYVCLTVTVRDANGDFCTETVCFTVTIKGCGEPKGKMAPPTNTTDVNVNTLGFDTQVYPNPSSGKLSIEFNIDTQKDMQIIVYNSAMQQIAILMDSQKEAGKHTLEWTANKEQIARGTYYIMIKTGDQLKFEKVVLTD